MSVSGCQVDPSLEELGHWKDRQAGHSLHRGVGRYAVNSLSGVGASENILASPSGVVLL